MARNSIDVDGELVAAVMARYGLPSKSSAAEFALRRVALAPMTRDEVLAMRGTGFELTNDELEATAH